MTTKQLIKRALKRTPIRFWFHISFWKYLLEKGPTRMYCSRWHRFWCRAAGHPDGPWWYSYGNEPDMTCKSCGDEL